MSSAKYWSKRQDRIFVEALKIKDLMHDSLLAGDISGCSWDLFLHKLTKPGFMGWASKSIGRRHNAGLRVSGEAAVAGKIGFSGGQAAIAGCSGS